MGCIRLDWHLEAEHPAFPLVSGRFVGLSGLEPAAIILKGESLVSCGEGLEGDAVAEGLELGDRALAGTVAVAAGKEVAAEVGIVAVVGQQVPGNDQD